MTNNSIPEQQNTANKLPTVPNIFFFNKVSLLSQNEANMQHLQWLFNCQVIGAIKNNQFMGAKNQCTF